MPAPEHATQELIKYFAAIGNATLGNLLAIPPDLFETQLSAARDFGASYLTEDKQHKILGISAATSAIKNNNILNKYLILPQEYMRKAPELTTHYIVSLFLQGSIDYNTIPNVSEVNVAGWTTVHDIQKYGQQPPAGFNSKIQVIAMPCTMLNPIGQLITHLGVR